MTALSVAHSIRLRLIGRLKRILDQAIKLRPEHLREPHTQPKAGADMRFRPVIAIDYGLGKRQINDPVIGASFGENRRHDRRNAAINNDPVCVLYLQGLSAANNDFLCHLPSPRGVEYDLTTVNAPYAGVQR